MQTNIAFIATSKSITVVLNGHPHTITSDNSQFEAVKQGLRDRLSAEKLERLFNVGNAMTDFVHERVVMKDDHLYLDGEELPQVLFERIKGFMDDGLPYEPMINFLNRLAANPSRRAVQELYTWLEHKKLPITDDGFLLGYKNVRPDFTDWYSGKVDNHVGQTPTMSRNQVDDEKDRTCSHGYHVGSLEYAKTFYTDAGHHLLIVKVDPADVVSIPSDCNCQKMRTCRYEVLSEYTEPLPDKYAPSKARATV